MMSENAERIIDVGCDHGYLAAFMLMSGRSSFAYVTDIRSGPLERAAETIRKAGLESKTELRLCSGLDTFKPEDADTVFICGMGGEVISAILADAPWTKDGRHDLILQPMTKDEYLRRFLEENGYGIKKEKIAVERNRLYTVILAVGGGNGSSRKNMFLFSDSMVNDEHFGKYLEKKRKIYHDIAEAKKAAGIDNDDELKIIDFLEEKNAC